MPGHQLRCVARPDLCRVLQQCNRIQWEGFVFYGSENGYSNLDRDTLPSVGTTGLFKGDFNGDGYVDVVLTSYRNAGSYIQNSIIYYGSSTGLDSVGTEVMATAGALRSCIET